ncbi:hypothetical protein CLV59_107368 [Chitinophaga dinghuensis]|uniref:Uncharacterized protein n=1 Tax=Chitinophaga dinghuensis TaxID=1539050 RepID=A0A327VQY4_9BACT|nr:hypothetical protein CLV59_107368 [Chitinophaga dinghuensis]
MPDKFTFYMLYMVIDFYSFSRFSDNSASVFIEFLGINVVTQ